MNIYMVFGGFILFSVAVSALICFFMLGTKDDKGGRHGR